MSQCRSTPGGRSLRKPRRAWFPERYYHARYPAPGSPALAAQVRGLLSGTERAVDAPDRGLDHGAYVPLTVMYPDADIPVLQISMPTLDPVRLLAIPPRSISPRCS